jgi:hypothetical protein
MVRWRDRQLCCMKGNDDVCTGNLNADAVEDEIYGRVEMDGEARCLGV